MAFFEFSSECSWNRRWMWQMALEKFKLVRINVKDRKGIRQTFAHETSDTQVRLMCQLNTISNIIVPIGFTFFCSSKAQSKKWHLCSSGSNSTQWRRNCGLYWHMHKKLRLHLQVPLLIKLIVQYGLLFPDENALARRGRTILLLFALHYHASQIVHDHDEVATHSNHVPFGDDFVQR